MRTVDVVTTQQTFRFSHAAVGDFPDTRPFLQHLLDQGKLSSATATTYVKLAARLRRTGRLADPTLIVHNVERTAANAYLRWKSEAYELRLAPVARALATNLPNRRALRWLRVHSLVPPYAGKQVPLRMPGFIAADTWEKLRAHEAVAAEPMQVTWQASDDAWTLHVPAGLVAVHTDPCDTCTTITLTAAQLETIAAAFEMAWGHRDIRSVAGDAFLFGEPPPEAVEPTTKPRGERIVALASDTATSDGLTALSAKVTRDVPAFVARLAEGAEGVYLSRSACGANLLEVLAAVGHAWGEHEPAAAPVAETA